MHWIHNWWKNSLILVVFDYAICWISEGTDVSQGIILFLFGRYCSKIGSIMGSKWCQKLITKWLKKVFKNWLKITPKNEQKWTNLWAKKSLWPGALWVVLWPLGSVKNGYPPDVSNLCSILFMMPKNVSKITAIMLEMFYFLNICLKNGELNWLIMISGGYKGW